MLVLSRKEGEKIKIGENIWITVVRVAGNKVRLGVDAPPSIMVDRAEIAAEKDKNQKQVPSNS
jgi:carbon storage regulator